MFKSGSQLLLSGGAAILALGSGVAQAQAQAYPNKPIRIFSAPAGSGADIATRLITAAITGPLGTPLVVENRPAGVTPPSEVARAQPDGYTLLYTGSSMWLGPFMRESTPYEPLRDFQPITQTVRQPALLVVPNSLPVNSVKELVALAKAKPGELNYGTATLGSLNHLGAEMFNYMAGVKVQRVEYKGGAQSVTDVVAGRIQMLFGTLSLVYPQVKAGKVKALGITSAQASELAPGYAPIASSGLPGYRMESNAGILAPAKTPRAIVDRLHLEISKAVHRQDVKEKFFATGAEPVGSKPEEFQALIKDEMTVLGKMIRDLGIKED